VEEARAQPRILRILRQALPWLVGIAILIVVATRVPLGAFRDAIGRGPHLRLTVVTLLVVLLVLCTDSLSTWFGLLTLKIRRPLSTVLFVRGATNVLFLINYALGQGGFGYYLHRSGVKPQRAVGATLFLMGTNLATLMILTTIAWAVHGGDTQSTMWWTLIGGCGAFALYLVVIAASPGPLARREVFAPLFDAGIRGHALAMLGRLPHMTTVVITNWIMMRAWGIEVPFGAGMALMPVVVIATVLPISPAGLGTTQAVMVYFFSDYATGATSAERDASILAFGFVQFVYVVACLILVGLWCVPFARRRGALRERET